MVVGLPLVIIGVIIVALTVLLPVFVAQTSSRAWHILQELKAIAKSLKTANDSAAAQTQQLHANNQLLRQLLRAYGHDPEA